MNPTLWTQKYLLKAPTASVPVCMLTSGLRREMLGSGLQEMVPRGRRGEHGHWQFKKTSILQWKHLHCWISATLGMVATSPKAKVVSVFLQLILWREVVLCFLKKTGVVIDRFRLIVCHYVCNVRQIISFLWPSRHLYIKRKYCLSNRVIVRTK